MLAVWIVVVLLFGHWLADFVWQPHWMSLQKSKNWWALGHHSFRITVGMYVTGAVVGFIHYWHKPGWFVPSLFVFALVNGAAHFAIDAVTSRVTSKLYREEKVHEFFVVIGFDQFLHVSIMVATILWVVHG